MCFTEGAWVQGIADVRKPCTAGNKPKPYFHPSHLSMSFEVPPCILLLAGHYVTNGEMHEFFDSEIASAEFF